MMQLLYLGFMGSLNCRKANGQESLIQFLKKVYLIHGFLKCNPQTLAFLYSISRRGCGGVSQANLNMRNPINTGLYQLYVKPCEVQC